MRWLRARDGRWRKEEKMSPLISSRRIFDCDPDLTNHHKNMILLPVSYTRSLFKIIIFNHTSRLTVTEKI
jgi:hypothetical protein